MLSVSLFMFISHFICQAQLNFGPFSIVILLKLWPCYVRTNPNHTGYCELTQLHTRFLFHLGEEFQGFLTMTVVNIFADHLRPRIDISFRHFIEQCVCNLQTSGFAIDFPSAITDVESVRHRYPQHKRIWFHTWEPQTLANGYMYAVVGSMEYHDRTRFQASMTCKQWINERSSLRLCHSL